jgi:hypothetical protein
MIPSMLQPSNGIGSLAARHTVIAISIALMMPLAFAARANAQDRVLGLLQLPEVFSTGPCVPFFPRNVTLYDSPDGKTIGTIEVDQNWSFAPHGGCEGLEVRVHQGKGRVELPTREFDYEAPAAIVIDRRSSWFKIRLDGNASAWVRTDAPSRFLSIESLFEEFTGLTFIADASIRELRPAPNTSSNSGGVPVKAGQPVRVIEISRAGDRLWLHVEVYSHSMCTAATDGPPETIGRGWLPAHAADGEPVVWFASRGC